MPLFKGGLRVYSPFKTEPLPAAKSTVKPMPATPKLKNEKLLTIIGIFILLSWIAVSLGIYALIFFFIRFLG